MGRHPDAVQQRHDDTDGHAGLDGQSHDGQHRQHGQQRFRRTATHDVGQDAETEDARGDKQQHAGKRRLRNRPQQRTAPQDQRGDQPRGDERPQLRSHAGFDRDRRAGRAGIHREGSQHRRSQIAGAEADEIGIGVGRTVLGEAAIDGGDLHHDDEDQQQCQGNEMRQDRQGRKRGRKRQAGNRSEGGDAEAFGTVRPGDGRCRRDPDQRAGNAAIDPLGQEDGSERAQTEEERIGIEAGKGLDDGEQAGRNVGRRHVHPQHRGELRGDDMNRDARQKAGDHRGRQETGDEAEPEQAGQKEQNADEDGEHDGAAARIGLIGSGEAGQRQREDRRDGRIRPAGQHAAASEDGEADRGADKSIEADLRREAAQLCRRHLLGNSDGGKRGPAQNVGPGLPKCPPFQPIEQHRSAFSSARRRPPGDLPICSHTHILGRGGDAPADQRRNPFRSVG